MIAIDFPDSPTIGQIYPSSGAKRWQWNGVGWIAYTAPLATVAVTGSYEDLLDRPVSEISLKNLLVYYGYPISYNGLNDVNGVISSISSSYSHWIVGDTYGDTTHEEYLTTKAIIDGVRAEGVIVYGYVPIGENTEGLTVGQIKAKIDEWFAVGVDGIFLDEFGFDFANTRAKQIEIVDYVHSLDLPYCANAWIVEDFACDDVSEIGYTIGDWRYTNFVTYNPLNLPLTRYSTDSYMFENFCFDHLGVSVISNTQERAVNVTARAAAGNFSVWALAVLGESTPGNYDEFLIGTFNSLDDVSAYVSANAFLYDYSIVGIGGYSFGAGGSPINVPLYSLPLDAKAPEFSATNNYVTKICFRFFGNVKLTITNTDTLQAVSIENTAAKIFTNSEYPNNVVPKIIVSGTEPVDPVLNTLWIQLI